MSTPLVSVVIPVYNRTDVIKDAVESVLCQTYKNREIIVVDDGSERDMEKALQPYMHLINFIKLESNMGVSKARNRGIEAAKGEYIAFLDSDDIFLPFKLEMQIEYMTTNNLYASHTDEFWFKHGKFINQGVKHKKYGGKILCKILDHCRISPSSFMAKKDIFAKTGMFDENLPIAEDYELWLRVALFYEIGYLETKTIVKRYFLNDHLSTKIKHIESYRLKALENFYTRFKNLFTPEQVTAIEKEIKRKREIVSSGISKKRLKEKGN